MQASQTVAVIIPAYNCAEYIEEALNSLESQTLVPDEVVVVDDGSTDSTAEVVARFQAKSNLMIILARQPNQGAAVARNAGVSRCSAAFIAFLDGDDAFYPRFIERAKRALIEHTELVLCFSDRDVVDEKGKFIRRNLDLPKFRALKTAPLGDDVSVLTESPFTTLVGGSIIPMGNLMLRTETFHEVDGFDEDLLAVEDKSFLLALAKLGTFGFIDEPLGIWRRHDTNMSGPSNAFKMNWYEDLGLRKLESGAAELGLSECELETVRRQRRLMPRRLLYTAADSANRIFPRLAFQFAKERQVELATIFRNTARYLWRYLTSSIKNSR